MPASISTLIFQVASQSKIMNYINSHRFEQPYTKRLWSYKAIFLGSAHACQAGIPRTALVSENIPCMPSLRRSRFTLLVFTSCSYLVYRLFNDVARLSSWSSFFHPSSYTKYYRHRNDCTLSLLFLAYTLANYMYSGSYRLTLNWPNSTLL